MIILAFDPAGEGGDIGWAIVDTKTKEVTYGKEKSNYIITKPVTGVDIVISENYNPMFNNGDAFKIKTFNENLKVRCQGLKFELAQQARCQSTKFELVQPQARLNVPDSVINKLIRYDNSHHKDVTSALKHALNYASRLDFNFNLYLMNELESRV